MRLTHLVPASPPIAWLLTTFLSTLSYARPDDTAQTTTPLRAVVTQVSGLVGVRATPGTPFQPVTVGMTLSEGAEFRTGPDGRLVAVIADAAAPDPSAAPDSSAAAPQVLRIDPLTRTTLLEATRTGPSVNTTVGMRYGRSAYAVPDVGPAGSATIVSPASTLSVRGTRPTLEDRPPFAPVASVSDGRADFAYARRVVSVGTGSAAVSRVRGGDSSPADTSLKAASIDPAVPAARTPAETAYIRQQQSRGGLVSFDDRAGIDVVRGGLGPQTDESLRRDARDDRLPGRLNIVLRWNDDTDLNLVVNNQVGDPLELLAMFSPDELIFPGYGLQRARTGGRIDVDHRGGPDGGQEIVYWPDRYPDGIYGVQALHAGGSATSATFNAFVDGRPVSILADQTDPVTGQVVVDEDGLPVLEIAPQITRRLNPGQDAVGVVLVPAIFDEEPTAAGRVRRVTSAPAVRAIHAASAKPSPTSPLLTHLHHAGPAGPRRATP